MSLVWSRSALLALALLLAWTSPAQVAQPLPGPAGAALTGQFLVATPAMADLRFRGAVILIVRHDANGAIGIIVNHPIAERSMAELLEATGQDSSSVTGTVRIHFGGPVRPQVGFVLHSTEYRRPTTLYIDGQVAMTNSPDILWDICHTAGPARSLIAFGYTGWGPGQLDRELAQDAWFTIPNDPALVFDEDRGQVWNRAMARRTIPL